MWRNKIDEEIPLYEIKEQLQAMVEEHRQYCQEGRVADYIPYLGKANPCHLAVCLRLMSGETVEAGDVEETFTMQSISKVLALAVALQDLGEEVVFDKVGMEPTGDPFNSIVKLETTRPNKPLNPMINAGAIAVTSLIQGGSPEERLGRILQLVHDMTGNTDISYNENVARSENETAHLNRSLSYFMKEYDVIEGDIEETLDVYFKQCAIEVRCSDLSMIGAVLANNGRCLRSNYQILPEHVAKICKTFMVTCGMYNASGEFAIRVGIPAKSGVSGGILGAIPFQLGLGVYGPALGSKGNSLAGFRLLEAMSKRWRLSIF
jgi:glutaminase